MSQSLSPADLALRKNGSLFRYLPRILWYPLRGSALWFTFGNTSLIVVFGTNILGLLVLVVAISALLQFLLLVVRETASGRGDPPRMSSMESVGFSKGTALLVGIALFAVTLNLSADAPDMVVVFANLLLLAAAPIILLQLAVTDRFSLAFSPDRIFTALANAGLPYLVFLAMMIGSGWFATELLSGRADSFVATTGQLVTATGFGTLMVVCFFVWLLIALCHYLGFIALHRYERMGLDSKLFNTREVEEVEPDVLAEVDRFLANNNIEAAHFALGHLAAELPAAIAIEVLDELEKRRAWDALRHYTEVLLSRLLRDEREDAGVDVLLRMLRHFQTLKTRSADEWLRLTRAAWRLRPDNGFEMLAALAPQRFPNDPILLDVALLKANHLVDRKKDPQAALKVLEPFLAETGHPRHARLLALRDALS
ncbi:MAG: hypothetical protein R3217_04295 [Gammaproteobacteria bacterium]|nr:hypothetical protein [Gammaproteobacteria bacterium]